MSISRVFHLSISIYCNTHKLYLMHAYGPSGVGQLLVTSPMASSCAPVAKVAFRGAAPVVQLAAEFNSRYPHQPEAPPSEGLIGLTF